ncbi:MAG: pitrilysin family protein, partial [Pseudomonadota bacterium]
MDGAANGPQSHLRDDPGGAAPESAPNVRITTLANGLRVVTEAMPHLQSAALGVWIGAGARAEHSHESGIAHMLEHMAFKGTERRTAQGIAEEIEAVGGDLNAMTSFETTAYYARVLADDVPLAIDILGDILINSRFDPAELERERGVILQEIRAAHDTPDDLVFDLAQRAAFGDQPLGRPILGTTESVSGFQSADLQSYLGRMYGPDRMILAAAGAVEHDAVVALAESTFESRPVPEDTPLAPAHFQGGFEGVARDLEQVHLVKGFEGWSYRSPDIYAAQVLAGVLGGGMSSRLFQEAREKRGLC